MQCRCTPLVEASSGQEQYYQVSLTFTVMHKVDLTFWEDADLLPSRSIWWPRAVLCLFAHFIFSCCRGKSYIGIWIGDMSSWTLSNLCRLLCVVAVVTVSYCCCPASVIVDHNYRWTRTTTTNYTVTTRIIRTKRLNNLCRLIFFFFFFFFHVVVAVHL